MDVDFNFTRSNETDQSHCRSVYIAGKMRGLADWGRRHFCEVEDMLASDGYVVLNPAVLPIGLPSDKYLPICMAMLEAADSVYMLSGWESSEGARIEYAYAVCQGKHVIFEDGQCADDDMPWIAVARNYRVSDTLAERNCCYGSKEDNIQTYNRTEGASGNTERSHLLWPNAE